MNLTRDERIFNLEERHAPLAVEILSRSFESDPLFVRCCPEPGLRRTWASYPMRWVVWRGIAFGTALGIGEPLAGVIFAFPPGSPKMTPELIGRSGYSTGAAEFGQETWDQFTAADESLYVPAEERLIQTLSGPAWYLDVLGVDPAAQGNGLGTRLIQAVIERAESTDLPISVLTFQAKNVPLYRRMGFEVICHGDDSNDDLPWWGMIRASGG